MKLMKSIFLPCFINAPKMLAISFLGRVRVIIISDMVESFNPKFLDGDASGLNKEDLAASIATLKSLTETCGVEMLSLREKTTTSGRTIAEYLLRRKVEDEDFIEVR